MPKKIKLSLNDLKVQSFVTALDNDERARLKGGTGDDTNSNSDVETGCNIYCGPTVCSCVSCDLTCLSLCTAPPGCPAC